MLRCADAMHLDEGTPQRDSGGSPFEATLAGRPPRSRPQDRTTVAVPTAQCMMRQVRGGSSKVTTRRRHVRHNPPQFRCLLFGAATDAALRNQMMPDIVAEGNSRCSVCRE